MVERSYQDAAVVINTYKGKHNHPILANQHQLHLHLVTAHHPHLNNNTRSGCRHRLPPSSLLPRSLCNLPAIAGDATARKEAAAAHAEEGGGIGLRREVTLTAAHAEEGGGSGGLVRRPSRDEGRGEGRRCAAAAPAEEGGGGGDSHRGPHERKRNK